MKKICLRNFCTSANKAINCAVQSTDKSMSIIIIMKRNTGKITNCSYLCNDLLMIVTHTTTCTSLPSNPCIIHDTVKEMLDVLKVMLIDDN